MPVFSREGERKVFGNVAGLRELGNAAVVHAQTDSIMAVGQIGHTALHIAVQYNFLEVAQLLLGAGASVDARNKVKAGCS